MCPASMAHCGTDVAWRRRARRDGMLAHFLAEIERLDHELARLQVAVRALGRDARPRGPTLRVPVEEDGPGADRGTFWLRAYN